MNEQDLTEEQQRAVDYLAQARATFNDAVRKCLYLGLRKDDLVGILKAMRDRLAEEIANNTALEYEQKLPVIESPELRYQKLMALPENRLAAFEFALMHLAELEFRDGTFKVPK